MTGDKQSRIATTIVITCPVEVERIAHYCFDRVKMEEMSFSIGNLVLVRKSCERRKSGKISHYWTGPHKIRRQLSYEYYEVKFIGRNSSDIVDVAFLKLYKKKTKKLG